MKNPISILTIRFLLIVTLTHCHIDTFSQNIGINISAPLGKLHVKGDADVSQLIIDANSTQGNLNPLIKLRKSDGTDLMWIHSDHTDNTFIGLNSGRVNNSSGGAIYNTFMGSRAGFSNTTGY